MGSIKLGLAAVCRTSQTLPVSKQIFAIEQFHAKSERGVKQELNAHFTLISLNRTITHHADRTRPPSQARPFKKRITLRPIDLRPPLPRRTNFKAAVGNLCQNLEPLILRGATHYRAINHVITNAVRRTSLVRLGRKYPRVSHRMYGLRWTPTPAKKKPAKTPSEKPDSANSLA